MIKFWFVIFISFSFALSGDATEFINEEAQEAARSFLKEKNLPALYSLLDDYPSSFIEYKGRFLTVSSIDWSRHLEQSDRKLFLAKQKRQLESQFEKRDWGVYLSLLEAHPSSSKQLINIFLTESSHRPQKAKSLLSQPANKLEKTSKNKIFSYLLQENEKIGATSQHPLVIGPSKVSFLEMGTGYPFQELAWPQKIIKSHTNGQITWLVGQNRFWSIHNTQSISEYELPTDFLLAGWPLETPDFVYAPIMTGDAPCDFYLARWRAGDGKLLNKTHIFSRLDRKGRLREEMWLPGPIESTHFYYLTHCGVLLRCSLGDGRPQEIIPYPSLPTDDILAHYRKKSFQPFFKRARKRWIFLPQDNPQVFSFAPHEENPITKLNEKESEIFLKQKGRIPFGSFWLERNDKYLHLIALEDKSPSSKPSSSPKKKSEESSPSPPFAKTEKSLITPSLWQSGSPLELSEWTLQTVHDRILTCHSPRGNLALSWPKWEIRYELLTSPLKPWQPPSQDTLQSAWPSLNQRQILTGDSNEFLSAVIYKDQDFVQIKIKDSRGIIWNPSLLLSSRAQVFCLDKFAGVIDPFQGHGFILKETGEIVKKISLLDKEPPTLYVSQDKFLIASPKVLQPFQLVTDPRDSKTLNNTFSQVTEEPPKQVLFQPDSKLGWEKKELAKRLLEGQRRLLSVSQSKAIRSPRSQLPLRADGVLDDGYSEKDALSLIGLPNSRVYTTHNADGLLIGAYIPDSSWQEAEDMDDSKKGDLLIVAWDPLQNARWFPEADDHFFVFGPRDPNNPLKTKIRPLKEGESPFTGRAAVSYDPEDKAYSFELFLPWKDVGHFLPIRFNIAYQNGDENNFYRLSPGIEKDDFTPKLMLTLLPK